MSLNSAGLEEAAYIASEYLYSVDNLPNEVSHLLQEIKHRDTRTQELQQEIDKDSARYIRHSLRPSAAPNSPSSPSVKLATIPGKISAAYAEMQELSTQKQELARHLVTLIERTRTRLDTELSKTRLLQGDVTDYTALITKPLWGGPAIGVDPLKMPVLVVTESLKSALAGSPPPRQTTPAASPMTTVTAGASAHKRRKVTVPATAWAQSRSASPIVQPPATHQRSRLSRQIHQTAPEDTEEMEADGDEEEADDGDGDDRLYCYCQKQSYGDMIACDNEGDCPYEWFHLSCASIKGPTPERWYCDPCRAKLGGKSATGTTRKGRKK